MGLCNNLQRAHRTGIAARIVSSQRLGSKDAGDACDEVLNEQEWLFVNTMLQFSPREAQLVRALCRELKDQAIAAHMGISVHTVRTHFERLFRKLKVNSRVGIVVCVARAFRQVGAVRQDGRYVIQDRANHST